MAVVSSCLVPGPGVICPGLRVKGDHCECNFELVGLHIKAVLAGKLFSFSKN